MTLFPPAAIAPLLAAVAMLSLLLGPGSALADVGALLAEVVAAHGGGTTPTAIHERGNTESLRRGSGPVERWWQAPDSFRIEIRYPDAAESRMLHGAEAWQQGRPATPALHGAVQLQAARMALPWRLQANAARVVDLGTQPDGAGGQLRALEWTLREGLRLIVDVDPETRLIRRSRGILSLNGASMEFATGYENYQLVEGRRIAMTERHFAMGQYIGSTQLTSVEFPAVLPAPTFVPPVQGGLRVEAPVGRRDDGA